jgi:putative transposase
MPRSSRIIIADCPHHIIQRGHNKQTIFAADQDYQYYLENLMEWKGIYGCKVYAYCLMTNHIHLVIDPGAEARNISLVMKRVAGRQTRYVNALEKRTGSLWEGRYKSSPISTDEYLLACCRYVELNPIRAGIVSDPSEYKWSSYCDRIGLHREHWLDEDPCYAGLAKSRKKREELYAAWVKDSIPEGEWELIRKSLQRGQLTGSNRFIDEIETKINHRIEFRGQGRPRKNKK